MGTPNRIAACVGPVHPATVRAHEDLVMLRAVLELVWGEPVFTRGVPALVREHVESAAVEADNLYLLTARMEALRLL